MLKILSTKSIEPSKDGAEVGGNSRAKRDGRCKLDRNEIGNNKVDNEVDNKIGRKDQKNLSPKNCLSLKKQYDRTFLPLKLS